MSKMDSQQEFADGKFSLGLFGDTRSGKTVYLTALQWLAEEGRLPDGVEGLRPGDAESGRYLGRRVAQLRAGQWPEGTVDSTRISLLLDTPNESVAIHTCDFRGGDFGAAWYEGDREDTERFIKELFGGASAAIFLVDPAVVKAASAPGCMTVLAGGDWPIRRVERHESGGAGLSSGHSGRSEHGEREFES